MPRLWRGGSHATAAARPDFVAGRSDVEARNRFRAADEAVSVRRAGGRVEYDQLDRTLGEDVAGRLHRGMGEASAEQGPRLRWPRWWRRDRRHAQSRDDADEGWIFAE